MIRIDSKVITSTTCRSRVPPRGWALARVWGTVRRGLVVLVEDVDQSQEERLVAAGRLRAVESFEHPIDPAGEVALETTSDLLRRAPLSSPSYP